jgi:hypothetical protein
MGRMKELHYEYGSAVYQALIERSISTDEMLAIRRAILDQLGSAFSDADAQLHSIYREIVSDPATWQHYAKDPEFTYDYWKALDVAPAWAEPFVDLLRWSDNYDYDGEGNPLPPFLDLVGYNVETYGETYKREWQPLAPVEMDYLGRALIAFSDRPTPAMNWLQVVLALPR